MFRRLHSKNNVCNNNDSPPYLPFKIENQKFLKNTTSIEVFYRGIISLLEMEENDLTKYFKSLNNKYAKHGLGRINENTYIILSFILKFQYMLMEW